MASSQDNRNENDDRGSYDEDDECYAGIGFLMEANQPTVLQHYVWSTHQPAPSSVSPKSNNIRVSLNAIDDTPGAVQSGHYLWPAAKLLCDYLVQHQEQQFVLSVLELGAGCALASLAALQLWQRSLQCVLITDHDPTVLERARDNYETTLEEIMDSSLSEEDLNSAINALGSIPVCFECVEWGLDEASLTACRKLVAEHTTRPDQTHFDRILGTDLIYCREVVEPLLQTAAALLDPVCGVFLLSQSFVYDAETEQEIDDTCRKLGLQRKLLLDNVDQRIQEFRLQQDKKVETNITDEVTNDVESYCDK